ncbi:MAG: GMC family oxidoreductase [Alphaproteobacteria bacterium]
MPMKPREPHYDAVIVGSGVAGALVAKQLGGAGKKVLILEAGAPAPTNINAYMKQFYSAPAKVPESPYPPEPFTDPATLNAGHPSSLTLDAASWQNPKQSYLIQKGRRPFASTYERVGGGTALHWLGTSLRLLPNDFQMRSKYRRFTDWPIKYEDLEPWYGKAEIELGVSADSKDQRYLGLTFSKEYPMPGIPKSLTDMAVASAIDGMNAEGVVLSKDSVKSTPAARNSQPYPKQNPSRRVCAGNTNCIPICPIQAKYDPTITLNEAQGTGNVEICYQTIASEVVIDGAGRISQIKYLQYDEPTGPQTGDGSVSAKIFVIAAHAIETPRLLLMSKNGDRTRHGVANGSGMLGKNLMDHPYFVVWGLLPKPVYPYRGPLSTAGIEELRDGPFRAHRGAYRLEIGNEGWNFVIGGDPNITTVDFINGLDGSQTNPNKEAMFGAKLVAKLNDTITRQFRLGFLIEQAPEEKNRVELSGNQFDNLGLPRPQISYDLADYTKAGVAAAKEMADKIFERLGAKPYTKEPDKTKDPSVFEWPVNGKRTLLSYLGAGHIIGTYRMGTTSSNSVVDSDQRSWDHKNLFLIGSGVFPTSATANPTLTLAALALRTADTIIKKDLT